MDLLIKALLFWEFPLIPIASEFLLISGTHRTVATYLTGLTWSANIQLLIRMQAWPPFCFLLFQYSPRGRICARLTSFPLPGEAFLLGPIAGDV